MIILEQFVDPANKSRIQESMMHTISKRMYINIWAIYYKSSTWIKVILGRIPLRRTCGQGHSLFICQHIPVLCHQLHNIWFFTLPGTAPRSQRGNAATLLEFSTMRAPTGTSERHLSFKLSKVSCNACTSHACFLDVYHGKITIEPLTECLLGTIEFEFLLTANTGINGRVTKGNLKWSGSKKL